MTNTSVEQQPLQSAARDGRAVAMFLAVVVVLLAADLVSKALAFEHVAGEPVELNATQDPHVDVVPRHDAIIVIPKVLALKLTLNHGAVFGIGQGARWLFIAITVIAITAIGIVFWKTDRRARATQIALALVLAGALGNLYDRMFYGAVRDLLWLFPGVNLPFGLAWPGGSRDLYPWIFNLADVALVLGVLTILCILFFAKHPEEQTTKTPELEKSNV